MSQLQHDPRTKSMIKDALYEYLYTPVQKTFQVRLATIIDRNCFINGYGHPSFTYKGEYYTSTSSPKPRRSNMLHASLYPAMDAYLADKHRLNTEEIPYVLGYINTVLNATNNLPDYLHLLPDSVHAPVYKLLTTCPCNTRDLSDDAIELLRQKNENAIHLMKQRLVMNLIG